MRLRLRPCALTSAALAASALLCGPANAQDDAIDALLSGPPAPASTPRDEGRTAPAQAVPQSPIDPLPSADEPLQEEAAIPVAPASAQPGLICRTMTDMLRRSRKERICMSRSGWDALIRVARSSGPRGGSGARLAYRSRSSGR